MLEIKNLEKSFLGEKKKRLFQDFNLTLDKGEFVSVIGSNGAGKSTLMNIILGNIRQDLGSIKLGDKEISSLAPHRRSKGISTVYQDPYLGTSPSMSIYENLSMADNKGKLFNLTFGINKERKDRYRESLKELGLALEDSLEKKVAELSGGQRQCLALLMSTLNTPDLLLLDEHTAALDPKTSKIVMDKTKKIIQENNITTLMITHSLEDAIKYGDRLIMLKEGKIALDIKGEKKSNLQVDELFKLYSK